MSYSYTPPEFLQNQTADDIHRRMLDALPPGIDKSENNIPWDYTRPSALEKARFVQRELNETIKLIFPQWSYDEWLDLHAQREGLTRRAANPASGFLTVTGAKGTVIPLGFQFATPAKLTPSVIFESTKEIVLDGTPDSKGQVSVDIPIQAVDSGLVGNVAEDSIKLMVRPLSSISYITNNEPITGGTVAESDDELLERILEAIRYGISWTGNDADYVRWAREVPGVGQAITHPEWDDPNMPKKFHWTDYSGIRRCAGAVRLFIMDANGVPANQQIIDAVYNYIIRPDNRMERKAPIGATLTVSAFMPLYVDISANVTLKDGENLDTVMERFKANLIKYWLAAASENDIRDIQSGAMQNHIKYVFVCSTLAETEGIANYDHSTLLVNGGTTDIPIPLGEYPVTREVHLIEQT